MSAHVGSQVMGNFKIVLKCTKYNKIVHSVPLTCVVVISCVSGAIGGDLAGICGEARKHLTSILDLHVNLSPRGTERLVLGLGWG